MASNESAGLEEGPGDVGGGGGSHRPGDPAPYMSDTVTGGGCESPSNRRDSSLVSREQVDSDLGVDRLSVSFSVFDFDSDGGHWDGYAQQHSQQWGEDGSLVETFSRHVEVVPGARAFVGVKVLYVKSVLANVFGKVEFNPSRVVDPDGASLASVAETLEVFSSVVMAAGCVVVPTRIDELGSYTVKRIDVAKDFQCVTSPSALIRGLAPIPRNWARKNLVHADPSKHGAQTLMVGSKEGVVRLYDKFAETHGQVAPGTLRWEVEARATWASKYGSLRLMSDLPNTGIEKLALDRWEWSAMGVEVSTVSGVLDVVAALGLSERESTMFLGWLVRQSTPYAWSPSFTTVAKFRRLQRELGISVGPDALDSMSASCRLDWQLGEAVFSLKSAAT